MPFTKVPKACTDAGVGLQSLNALSSNSASLKAELEVEHSPEQSLLPAAQAAQGAFEGLPQFAGIASVDASFGAGAHDDIHVARGTAVVLQTSTDPSLVTAFGVKLSSVSGALQSIQVISTGVYFFPMDGWAEVWGKATARMEVLTGSGIGLVPVDARVYPDVSGLVVRTFRLQNPDAVNDIMYPFHTGFYLVAFGRRTAAPTAPARLEPLRPSRFARGPTQWLPSKGK